jgi:hypothetical protein
MIKSNRFFSNEGHLLLFRNACICKDKWQSIYEHFKQIFEYNHGQWTLLGFEPLDKLTLNLLHVQNDNFFHEKPCFTTTTHVKSNGKWLTCVCFAKLIITIFCCLDECHNLWYNNYKYIGLNEQLLKSNKPSNHTVMNLFIKQWVGLLCPNFYLVYLYSHL